jgi:hypothetical protein
VSDYDRKIRLFIRVQLGLALVAAVVAAVADLALWFVPAALAALVVGTWSWAEIEFRKVERL